MANYSDFLNLPKSKAGSSTEYGASLLAGKIRRDEEQAKAADSFGKWVTGIKGVIGFGNAFLDNFIEDADQKQQWQMGAYQDMLNRKNNIIGEDDLRITENISVEAYLTNKYQAEIMAQLTDMYEGQMISIPHLKPYARAEARRMAQEDQGKYTALVNSSRKFPKFEDFPKVYGEYSDTPRSLGEFVGSRIREWGKKETPASLEAKNKKELDALYGSDMFDKFKDLKADIDAYDAVIGDGPDLLSVIAKAKKEGKFVGRIFEEGVQTYSEKSSDGLVITEDHHLLIPRYEPDGSISSTSISIGSTTTPADGSLMTISEVTNLFSLVKPDTPHWKAINLILNSGTAGRPGIVELNLALDYLNDNPEAFKVDWEDEVDITNAFPVWYTGKIKNIMIDDPKSPKGPQVHIGRPLRGSTLEDEWEINPIYQIQADQLGLDKDNMLQEFLKYGLKTKLPSYSNTQSYLTATELRNKGFKPVDEMFVSPKQKEEYTNFVAGANDPYSEFNMMFRTRIDQYKDSPLDIIPLVDDFDISNMFPSITGTGSIYFNRDTNVLFFKAN